MRKILILLFFTFSSAVGQDYQLFNSTSKKLYASIAPPYSTYSISFDSTSYLGSDSTYYNFFLINNAPQPSLVCPFWVSGCAYMCNKPSWIGSQVKLYSGNSYRFFNNNGDSLYFNLNMNIGDTSLFYLDSVQRFNLVFDGVDTATVLGTLDTTKSYRILHTDTFGNQITSLLN